MDYMKDLHELCETINDAIKDANEKIRSAGGKLTAGDVEYVDKLTHSLKSVKAVMSMMEDEGYSGYNSSYADGGSYRGSSYRGRRRDSMGRYSRNGYARNDLSDKMRMLMDEAPDEHTRSEIQRMIDRLDNV